jgi:hypothetical protein
MRLFGSRGVCVGSGVSVGRGVAVFVGVGMGVGELQARVLASRRREIRLMRNRRFFMVAPFLT